MITWVQRRGQIKHLLYEMCLTGRIDRETLAEQFNDLNNVTPVVRCKDCVYYEHEVDDPHKSNCQRLWGGMIDCKPESYCSDGITIEDYKRKMALRVNALMDGGEK
jgi:hypothetical protein